MQSNGLKGEHQKINKKCLDHDVFPAHSRGGWFCYFDGWLACDGGLACWLSCSFLSVFTSFGISSCYFTLSASMSSVFACSCFDGMNSLASGLKEVGAAKTLTERAAMTRKVRTTM